MGFLWRKVITRGLRSRIATFSSTSTCKSMETTSVSSRVPEEIHFGPWTLDSGQIFLETNFCYGIVNLKPIVPGHVLIIPKRVCPRLKELTSEEIADLFATVHRVGPIIENYYTGDSLNIAIQDGKSAGQSVPHVHVHIIPRREGDFARNDEVHERLEQHDATIDFTKPRLPRSKEDMSRESAILRELCR